MLLALHVRHVLIDDLVAAHHLVVPVAAPLPQLHGLGRAPCGVVGLVLQRRLGAFDVAGRGNLQRTFLAIPRIAPSASLQYPLSSSAMPMASHSAKLIGQ